MSHTLALALAVAAACLCAGASALAQVRPAPIMPADPVAGEKVLLAADVCQGGSPTWIDSGPVVQVEGQALKMQAVIGMSGFAVASCVNVHALSAPLAAGTYQATFSYTVSRSSTGGETHSLGTVTVAPAGGNNEPRYRGLNGNWYDPAAPGTGVNVVQGASGALFAAWLTHPPASRLLVPGGWYVMPEGRWISPNVFRGALYTTSANAGNRAWDAAKLSVQPAGYLKLSFVGPDEAELHATILYRYGSSVEKRQTLRRQLF